VNHNVFGEVLFATLFFLFLFPLFFSFLEMSVRATARAAETVREYNKVLFFPFFFPIRWVHMIKVIVAKMDAIDEGTLFFFSSPPLPFPPAPLPTVACLRPKRNISSDH